MSIDDRLENWSRYYRTQLKINVCGSMEGKLYHAPWRQWCEYKDLPLFKVLDWKDAELIEATWKTMQGTPKEVLKLTYVAYVSKSVLCRRAGIKPWQVAEELTKAKNILEGLLILGKTVVTLRHNSNRASEKFSPSEADFLRTKQTQAA